MSEPRGAVFLIPGVRVMREQPVRRLTPGECDLVEYAPPLILARREYRFLMGLWRSAGEYLVMRNGTVLMTCTEEQLLERGVPIDAPDH